MLKTWLIKLFGSHPGVYIFAATLIVYALMLGTYMNYNNVKDLDFYAKCLAYEGVVVHTKYRGDQCIKAEVIGIK